MSKAAVGKTIFRRIGGRIVPIGTARFGRRLSDAANMTATFNKLDFGQTKVLRSQLAKKIKEVRNAGRYDVGKTAAGRLPRNPVLLAKRFTKNYGGSLDLSLNFGGKKISFGVWNVPRSGKATAPIRTKLNNVDVTLASNRTWIGDAISRREYSGPKIQNKEGKLMLPLELRGLRNRIKSYLKGGRPIKGGK